MTIYVNNLQAKEVDIAFLLEGSYPYVLGGVSAWVHQLIENFPQYTFALIFLGAAPEFYKEGLRYSLPKNVTHFQVHYLFEETEPPVPKQGLMGNAEGFACLKEMHEHFRNEDKKQLQQIGDISLVINGENGIDYEQFLYSQLSWDFIKESYTKQCEDSSFIDYFWTIKNLHKPLWRIISAVKDFPKVKIVHTVSTGYAGFLSFLLERHYHYPVILTEHGIYTRERKIDIFLSQIFRDEPESGLTESSYLRSLWDRYFHTFSHLSYLVAQPIISLFDHAHRIQLEEGASPDKTIVIPNGVDIQRLKKLRRSYEERSQIICLIGRVVPVKDVKGLIRAVPNLHQEMPDLKVWIVGSTDQDPDYAKECIELVENTLLQDIIEFKPHQSLEEILPVIKLLVLPSIREGMPLVILESLAAGVPVVATDVGACEELVNGLKEEDMSLGAAGKIVRVANPKDLELAILAILQDPVLWQQMSESAIKRAEKFYDQNEMIEKYKQLYDGTINGRNRIFIK